MPEERRIWQLRMPEEAFEFGLLPKSDDYIIPGDSPQAVTV